MIDYANLKKTGGHSLVNFKNLPDINLRGSIYIENAYNKTFNHYLRWWGWLLWKVVFNRYKYGWPELIYIPSLSKRLKKRKYARYLFPFMTDEQIKRIPAIKTTDLLDYLEDPDDVRFLKAGFLFFKKEKENGITVFEYYPLDEDITNLFLFAYGVSNILESHEYFKKDDEELEPSRLGHGAALFKMQSGDGMESRFPSFCEQTQTKLMLFRKQIEELQKCGVTMEMLENILHENDQLSRLVIRKDNRIFLPDYDNMEIKMEPLVKAVYMLFLRHPEGIVFKELPDYREELATIYIRLRPHGLTERVKKSIEDVTDPMSNSINEKCARIRNTFIEKFNDHLARYYCVDGQRGFPKKVALQTDLIIWEE